jgi:hypothetical protein
MIRTLGALIVRVLAGCAFLTIASSAAAQSLTLSPSVVQLQGKAGQSVTQTLTITNGTAIDLAFSLEARDVVITNGTRVFVNAGEFASSLAATAVFSSPMITVPAGQSRSARVTLTVPELGANRAVVALFKGTTTIPTGRTTITASLGTLFTFNLSGRVSVAGQSPLVSAQTTTSNAHFEQVFVNDGEEPVVLTGLAVILDGDNGVVAKATFEPRRALPGESITMSAGLTTELGPGLYRVLLTFAFGGQSVTTPATLVAR